MDVEINLHKRSARCCDQGLEEMFGGYRDLWPLCLTAEPEGIHYPQLLDISNEQIWTEIPTCHINGMFLAFPHSRSRTKSLHNVTSDHI